VGKFTGSVSDREGVPTVGLPPALLEPVARYVLAIGGTLALSARVLTIEFAEAGFRMLLSVSVPNERGEATSLSTRDRTVEPWSN
jgi:hypothetical protein